MKALHFGAGNIGRGFIGKLLADAGIQLTFADVNQVVLDALNARHSYQVHVVGETEQVDTVSGVNAVSSIEQALFSSYDREIPSVRIGELTMEELKKIDEVAYIRFASVYRQFADVESFLDELKKLVGDRKENQ